MTALLASRNFFKTSKGMVCFSLNAQPWEKGVLEGSDIGHNRKQRKKVVYITPEGRHMTY